MQRGWLVHSVSDLGGDQGTYSYLLLLIIRATICQHMSWLFHRPCHIFWQSCGIWIKNTSCLSHAFKKIYKVINVGKVIKQLKKRSWDLNPKSKFLATLISHLVFHAAYQCSTTALIAKIRVEDRCLCSYLISPVFLPGKNWHWPCSWSCPTCKW
jgi:hypothetical protein